MKNIWKKPTGSLGKWYMLYLHVEVMQVIKHEEIMTLVPMFPVKPELFSWSWVGVLSLLHWTGYGSLTAFSKVNDQTQLCAWGEARKTQAKYWGRELFFQWLYGIFSVVSPVFSQIFLIIEVMWEVDIRILWIRCLALGISWSLNVLEFRDFPSSPVVKIMHVQCMECRFDPWWGN